MPRGYISIGSNIDKEKHIASSILALNERFGPLIKSDIFETEAIGFSGADFYNLVVGFDCDLPAKSVAKILKQIETDHGRTKSCQKFSPRTLDLDLILYGDQIINEGRLQIPRDEILTYAFVLQPLAEIAADLRHPISGQSYGQLWEQFDKTQLKQKRIGEA